MCILKKIFLTPVVAQGWVWLFILAVLILAVWATLPMLP
jgi:hypothetical protein